MRPIVSGAATSSSFPQVGQKPLPPLPPGMGRLCPPLAQVKPPLGRGSLWAQPLARGVSLSQERMFYSSGCNEHITTVNLKQKQKT